MRKFIKIVALILLVLFISGTAVIAEGIQKNIEAYFDSSKIQYNHDDLEIDNILYDNVLYVPLRAIAKVFDKEVAWDKNTKSVVILDKQFAIDGNGNVKTKSIVLIYNILHLFSSSLQIAGIIMLAQMVLFRSKKDLYSLLRNKANQNVDYITNKRLTYDTWLSKVAFYYLLSGIFISMLSQGSYGISIWLKLTSSGVIILLLLLLGWRKCKKEAYLQTNIRPSNKNSVQED